MSTPLNDFLETVDAALQATGTSDKILGKCVREAWNEFQRRERQIADFCKTHNTTRETLDTNGNPVKVSVPVEG